MSVLSEETRQRMEKSLVDFRFMALVDEPEDDLPSAYFHYDLSDELLYGKEHAVVEMFRESGKSSYALRAYPAHSLAYPCKDRDFIVIIKNNATLAKAKLKEIRDDYNTNPLLSHNLVKVNEDSAQIFDVDVRDSNGEVINVRIEAYGKGASIRGLVNKDKRPKIIVCDDIQDREDASSETVTQKDWDWFLSDIIFLGQKTRIFYIANNLGEKCIAERIIKNADNLKKIKFKVIKIPVMANQIPAWPEKESIEEILEERADFEKLGKLDIWYAEKMCQALAEESKIFKEEHYRYYEWHQRDNIIKDCKIYACLDPASSTNKDACLRAISVVGVDHRNFWYILDNRYGRWDSVQMINEIFHVVEEYELYDFGVEKGQIEQILGPIIEQEQRQRNIFFNLNPLEHAKQGTKLERIKMLQPRFKAHQVLMPKDSAPWIHELKAELAGVTRTEIKSEFIDCVDALAMQIQVAKSPVRRKGGTVSRQMFPNIRTGTIKRSTGSGLKPTRGFR